MGDDSKEGKGGVPWLLQIKPPPTPGLAQPKREAPDGEGPGDQRGTGGGEEGSTISWEEACEGRQPPQTALGLPWVRPSASGEATRPFYNSAPSLERKGLQGLQGPLLQFYRGACCLQAGRGPWPSPPHIPTASGSPRSSPTGRLGPGRASQPPSLGGSDPVPFWEMEAHQQVLDPAPSLKRARELRAASPTTSLGSRAKVYQAKLKTARALGVSWSLRKGGPVLTDPGPLVHSQPSVEASHSSRSSVASSLSSAASRKDQSSAFPQPSRGRQEQAGQGERCP